MTPYYSDEWLTVLEGDCREVMAGMEPESVHCVVTSPPYWGLRDYGTGSWEDGDPECDHKPDAATLERQNGRASTLVGTTTTQKQAAMARHRCKCGARRVDAQLGLEPTPEAYVAALVDVFREVRRVLRADGTVWLVLGDSYSRNPAKGGEGANGKHEYNPSIISARRLQSESRGSSDGAVGRGDRAAVRVGAGLEPKQLVGIPWRVAFALQADGWYLRSDIIWAKPNPMPESVTDRPTKSHEYVFLLTKSARYWYDADAVREAHVREWNPETNGGSLGALSDYTLRAAVPTSHLRKPEPAAPNPAGRNLRSVWTVATAPYPGAHFATFPPRLVEPCIKAGCPVGGVVLDPFAGTGTVGLVAAALSRRAVLIDLNAEYLRQCLERNRQMPLGVA